MLSLDDVAKRLNISYQAARMLVLYEEAIPYFKVGSRGTRVREEDLEAYIAKQGKEVEEEAPEEGQGSREPYLGSGILPGDTRRDKPPGVIKEGS